MSDKIKFGIEKLTSFDIPNDALNHRFVKEIREDLDARNTENKLLDPVFGTSNVKKPELYGWSGSVTPHVDNKGYCYILILELDGKSVLSADHSDDIDLVRGDIICLYDYTHHSIEQTGNSIAMFVGAFNERCDEFAIAQLADGLIRLITHDYYNAPRYLGREIRSDECIVSLIGASSKRRDTLYSDDYSESAIKLIVDAKSDGDHIETCSTEGCGNYAISLDEHYPYFSCKNTCREHCN